MSVCPVCGSDLEGDEAFCPYCSASLQDQPTAQWGPPAFDETAPAPADEDWTVALWGQPEETVVEEAPVLPSYETVVEQRVPPQSMVEETITLPTGTSPQEWYKNKLILGLIALSAILFVAFIVALLDNRETVVVPPVSVAPTPIAVTPQPTNEIPEGERPAVSQSPIAVIPAPTPAPTPATAQTWTQVASLEGTGPKKGPLFELRGGEAKLIYTVEGDQFAGMAIYVVREGESVDERGGSPDVNHQGAGSDETPIEKPAGRYYLGVNSANATWAVRVEELR